MSEETKKPATISKVIIAPPVPVKVPMQDENGAEINNIITPLVVVKIIMANGAMWGLVLPGCFGEVTKEEIMALYVQQPEVFTKIEQ